MQRLANLSFNQRKVSLSKQGEQAAYDDVLVHLSALPGLRGLGATSMS